MFKAISSRNSLGILVSLSLVFLATRLGGVFALSVDSPALFWPPNAVLLAALFLLDPKVRLTCLVLSIPMYVGAELWSGYPGWAALGFQLRIV
jgi:hypothetical protein